MEELKKISNADDIEVEDILKPYQGNLQREASPEEVVALLTEKEKPLAAKHDAEEWAAAQKRRENRRCVCAVGLPAVTAATALGGMVAEMVSPVIAIPLAIIYSMCAAVQLDRRTRR